MYLQICFSDEPRVLNEGMSKFGKAAVKRIESTKYEVISV